MGNTFFFAWEPTLMVWLQSILGAFGTALAAVFTVFGEELVMIALLGFLYLSYDKTYGVYIGTNLTVAVTWNPLLKNIFLRRRPYFDHAAIKCLRPVEADADLYDIGAQGYSFPSGHSSNAAATYGSVAWYKRKPWLFIAAGALIFLVGLSRVCLGVHYPTDVLVGWLLGFFVVALVSFLQAKIKRRPVLYALLLLTAVPGWFYCTTSDYYSAFGMMAGLFAADLFERRYVHFENTRHILRMILRPLGAIGLFLGLNPLLKLPFSAELLDSGTLLAHAIRAGRYAVLVFLIIGIYPMLFRVADGIFGKKMRNGEDSSRCSE